MNKKNTNSVCDCTVIHEDIVKKVRTEMPQSETMFEIAEFFRVFGDSTRINILYALSKEEMCGCDICALLNMTQSAVSHQMRLLKQARLVRSRREGKIVYFRLDDKHIYELLKIGSEHATE